MKKYMKRIASWICMMLLAVSMAVPVMAEGNSAVVNPSPSAGKVVNKGVEVTGVKFDPGKYVYKDNTNIFWYIPYKGKLTTDMVKDCTIILKKSDGTKKEVTLKDGHVATNYNFYMGHSSLGNEFAGLSEGTYEVISARLNFSDGTFSSSNAADFTEHKDLAKLELISETASVEGSTPSFKDGSGASVAADDVSMKIQQQNDDTYNDVVKNSGFSLSDVKRTSCFDIRIINKNTGFELTMTNGKIKVRVPVNNPNYTSDRYEATVYHIITNADGSQKAVVVPSVWPENAGYIEITADSFSPYVITYKRTNTTTPVNPGETVKPAAPANPANPANPADPDDDNTSTVVASQNNNNNTTGSSNSTSAAGTTDATNKAPKTGDKAPLAALLFVMTCGGAICAVSVKKMLAR